MNWMKIIGITAALAMSASSLAACGGTAAPAAQPPTQAQDNNGAASQPAYDNSPITMPEITQASVPEMSQYSYDNSPVTMPEVSQSAQSQNTVYFDDPIGWGDTYIYYWSDANKNMVKWPGEKMESFEGVWRFTLPEGVEYIIFSNGALQTRDVPYNPAQTNYRLSANRDQDKSYYVEDWQGNIVDSSRVDPKGKYN